MLIYQYYKGQTLCYYFDGGNTIWILLKIFYVSKYDTFFILIPQNRKKTVFTNAVNLEIENNWFENYLNLLIFYVFFKVIFKNDFFFSQNLSLFCEDDQG